MKKKQMIHFVAVKVIGKPTKITFYHKNGKKITFKATKFIEKKMKSPLIDKKKKNV